MLEILSKIKEISAAFEVDRKKVSNADEFEVLKNTFLGRKGLIANLFKGLICLFIKK